jgi:hypothetical protein
MLVRKDRHSALFYFERERIDPERLQHLADRPQQLGKTEFDGHHRRLYRNWKDAPSLFPGSANLGCVLLRIENVAGRRQSGKVHPYLPGIGARVMDVCD